MELLNIDDFDEVYALFQKAFIPEELRPYAKMKALFLKDQFCIYGFKQDQKIIGALIAWQLDGFVYVENFAIVKQLRGQGIGSQMIDDVIQMYPHQCIVLEVEKPVDTLTQRRIAFYQRHHFVLNQETYQQPSFHHGKCEVVLHLMSYPRSISEQFLDIKKEIFLKVYQRRI